MVPKNAVEKYSGPALGGGTVLLVALLFGAQQGNELTEIKYKLNALRDEVVLHQAEKRRTTNSIRQDIEAIKRTLARLDLLVSDYAGNR